MFAIVVAVVLIMWLCSLSEYVPTPSMKGVTPTSAATAFLSSSTPSLMAKSDRLSGLTCCTSMSPAGMIHGSPASLLATYSLSICFLACGSEKPSASASTRIMTLGFHLSDMKPFFVACSCRRLLTTSKRLIRSPSPCHG